VQGGHQGVLELSPPAIYRMGSAFGRRRCRATQWSKVHDLLETFPQIEHIAVANRFKTRLMGEAHRAP
jgi:hypothetical protein